MVRGIRATAGYLKSCKEARIRERTSAVSIWAFGSPHSKVHGRSRRRGWDVANLKSSAREEARDASASGIPKSIIDLCSSDIPESSRGF